MDFWTLELIALVFVFGLFKFCAETAALRGTKGSEFPPLLHRFLKLSFFMVMVAPVCFRFPLSIPFLAIYAYFYTDNIEQRGGAPIDSVKRWRIWYLVKSYFNLTILNDNVDAKGKTLFDPKQKYIFGLHPHGILPFGGMVNLAGEVNEVSRELGGVQVRFLAASFCFYIPLYREFCLAAGVVDAARFSAKTVLRKGYSVALYPGGATEALHASPDADILVLSKRKGFIKLALETGAHLVPSFTFNEVETFNQLSLNIPFVKWLKQNFQKVFGLSLPLITNIFPRRTNITTVIGKPIQVEKREQPTDAEIQDVLSTYISALTELYNAHKEKLNTNKSRDIKIL